MEHLREGIERAVSAYLPDHTLHKMNDRGEWIRRIVEVTLDEGEVVFFKMTIHPEWVDGASHEAQVLEIFQQHGLPTPNILAVDTSCEIIPYPYIIQERVGGTRLGVLLDQASEADARAISETLGHLYGRMHAIHNDRSGIWRESPDKPLNVSPNEYIYQAEIVAGSGKRALERGRISQRTYDRAVALWAEHMDYLKDHQPSLIHYSAFPWTIYLARGGGNDRLDDQWHVTKLMSLGDVMWWDPAYDLASLRYLPFGKVKPCWWEAFLRGYEGEQVPVPERRRVLLYAVLQRLCVAMGAYMEPQTERHKAWTEPCLEGLDAFLDKIEGSLAGE